jgi:peroxiredoxin Q/BCP
MEGKGAVVGTEAPEFSLLDETGEPISLHETLEKGPVLLAFYPADFTPVCTRQMCNYRDSLEEFNAQGIQILGISRNTVDSHKRFKARYDIPFPLLSDPKNNIARLFGCTSLLLFGGVSRAVFIVDQKGRILYRYVEPTPLTRRNSKELVQVIQQLKAQNVIT